MGGADIQRTLDGTLAFMAGRRTRPAVVVRRLLGHPDPTDAELSEHLIREIRRRTRIDGSMNGALAETAWSAWELMELGCLTDCAGLVRMVGYVLAQQDKPGHFGEGCTPEAHDRRHCHHFMAGFFSPGGRDMELAPLVLPSGVSFADEDEARLAASALTLRTVLRAGEDRRHGVVDHVGALLDSDLLADPWAGAGNPDLFFLLAGAIAYAPPEYRARLGEARATMADRQQPDGTWPDTYLFHALDMLAGMTGPEARGAAVRAAAHLSEIQRPNGAFDDEGTEEWVAIATRVLLAAQ